MAHTLTVLASWPPLYASSLFLSASKPHYAVAYPPPAIPAHVLSVFDVLSPPAKTVISQPVTSTSFQFLDKVTCSASGMSLQNGCINLLRRGNESAAQFIQQ